MDYAVFGSFSQHYYTESQIFEYIDPHKFFDNSKKLLLHFLIQGKLIALKYECN